MANILLINPSYQASYGGSKVSIINPIFPTLGLATIAAPALRAGHTVEIMVDRLVKGESTDTTRVADSIETALRLADGPDEVHRILIAKEILKKYHDGLSWDFGV